jgi:hypothetical protein
MQPHLLELHLYEFLVLVWYWGRLSQASLAELD